MTGRPSELRSDPVSLREVLLGEQYAGEGLLNQVERQVLEQDTIEGPQYRTGSVIPTGVSASKDSGSESGFSEECFGLLVSLTEWLGEGIRGANQPAKDLLTYLRKNRLTDVQVLTGRFGRIQQVRARVAELLPKTDERVPESSVATVTELVDYLLDWLGVECDHEWQEQASDDPRMTVLRCDNPDCGLHAYRYSDGKNVRWLAV